MAAQQAQAEQAGGEGAAVTNAPAEERVTTIVNDKPKVGRNDPCPCGSGKKYKHCCGRGA